MSSAVKEYKKTLVGKYSENCQIICNYFLMYSYPIFAMIIMEGCPMNVRRGGAKG